MTAIVVRANANALPLPDASVDLIVTSPPYWSLRSYQDGGRHYDGQIGSEGDLDSYLWELWDCTTEWQRVLKPTGSMWVNLGDKYSGAPSGPRTPMADGYDRDSWRDTFQSRHRVTTTIPAKSLTGIPWRYALGCIDQLGLILRAEVIWSKPNGLPESVTDRARRSHEQWFHMVKQPRYFSAVDEIREPQGHHSWNGIRQQLRRDPHASEASTLNNDGRNHTYLGQHPLGKLPGSVWEIPSEPLTVPAHLGVDHFAAFPTEWPRRLIEGWSPSGICTACGDGRRPVVHRVTSGHDNNVDDERRAIRVNGGMGGHAFNRMKLAGGGDRITGYTCPCDSDGYRSAQGLPLPPTRPSVVLDPFGGTGTTAAVASALGRIGISVDLSHDYSRLARWRTSDPATRAKIRGERPPVKQVDGQDALFEGVA